MCLMLPVTNVTPADLMAPLREAETQPGGNRPARTTVPR